MTDTAVNGNKFNVVEVYKNGKIKILGQIDTVENGHWVYFKPNGDTLAYGLFEKGIKVGTWQYITYRNRKYSIDFGAVLCCKSYLLQMKCGRFYILDTWFASRTVKPLIKTVRGLKKNVFKMNTLNPILSQKYNGTWTLLLLTTTFLLFGQQSNGQIDSLKEFAKNWKVDSVGENGYRSKNVVWDSIQKVYLIHGINFNGYKKRTVIALLGKPNYYGSFQYTHTISFFWGHSHSERRTLNYKVNTSSDHLTFVIRRNKVYYLNQAYIKNLEKL